MTNEFRKSVHTERARALKVAIDLIKAEINKHEKRIDHLKESIESGYASYEAEQLINKNIKRRRATVKELEGTLLHILDLKTFEEFKK